VRLHMQGERVQVNDAAFRAWVNDPNGPVRARLLEPRGAAVALRMVATAPKRTGLLAATVRRVRGVNPRGPHVDIIAGEPRLTPYLGYILRGTPPHMIHARRNRPNPHLRFIQGGNIRFAKKVFHPGTTANDFVTASLDAAR
jgi:hypothetical protein